MTPPDDPGATQLPRAEHDQDDETIAILPYIKMIEAAEDELEELEYDDLDDGEELRPAA